MTDDQQRQQQQPARQPAPKPAPKPERRERDGAGFSRGFSVHDEDYNPYNGGGFSDHSDGE